MFVTNLSPCSGVRLHLWPERKRSNSDQSTRAIEVTSKMVHIPSRPAPRQVQVITLCVFLLIALILVPHVQWITLYCLFLAFKIFAAFKDAYLSNCMHFLF